MTTEQNVNAKNLIKLTDVPGGELGGLYSAPTVDPIHSGSDHHATSHAHVSHTGIGANDHHAQAHRATHEKAGNDRIGQGIIQIDNAVYVEFLNTSGNSFGFIRLTPFAPNTFEMGHQSFGLYLDHLESVGLHERDAVDSSLLLSKRRLRYVIKAADEIVNNSTILQNDDELGIAVEANKLYLFRLRLRLVSTAVANFKFAFTIPAAASMRDTPFLYVASPPTADVDSTVARALFPTTGVDSVVTLTGHILTGANAGNVVLQWAQNTAEVSDTKVLVGSYLELLRA